MDRALFEALRGAYVQDFCLDALNGIWENDRLISYDAFARTADFVEGALNECGFDEVERLKLSADGETKYGDWMMPRAWDAVSAELRISCGSNAALVSASYPETPCALVMYSAPTPPGGVNGRVFLADDIDALSGVDLGGALLMTGGLPQEIIPLALERGAAGILSDYFPLYAGVRESRADVYDAHRWEGGFGFPNNDTGLFAFSLSPRQGDAIRAALAAGGELAAYARVDARLYAGCADTVSALIPGSTAREVFAFAHLYEPGANDNASGCAALMAGLRALNTAIASGAIPRPRCGIRLAMGFECVGSTGYILEHPDRCKLTEAGYTADMVGTESIDSAVFSLWHNPFWREYDSDIYMRRSIDEYGAYTGGKFTVKDAPFNIGTDNILADPGFSMPTVALIAEPALSYHSSMDTFERIQPEVVSRSALVSAMYLYDMATRPPAPRRMVPGCLNLNKAGASANITGEERARWNPSWNTRLNLPYMLADGRRSAGEIARLCARELGEDAGAHEGELLEYFSFLEKYGYIGYDA